MNGYNKHLMVSSKILGIAGVLSLILPWEIDFWNSANYLVTWHFSRIVILNQKLGFHLIFYADTTTVGLVLSILALFGFSLVLYGSALLIAQNRKGSILLIIGIIVWLIGDIVVELGKVVPYIIIPIGAALCIGISVISFRDYRRELGRKV